MSKIELPSDSKVREKILATLPMAGNTLIGAIYARAEQLGIEIEGRPGEFGEVIEQDRAMLHGKLDELLDLAADRDRLHQILDVAFDATIDGVNGKTGGVVCSDCADSAAASDASEQAAAVDYCQCCGQLFPILDTDPPAAEVKPGH